MPLDLNQKIKAFEYSLIRITQWYMEENHLTTIEEFNDQNDFGIDKVLLFPFFICTANGDREVLFSYFCNKFYPDETGLKDKDVVAEIDNLANFEIGLFNCVIMNNNAFSLNSSKEDILILLEASNLNNEHFTEIIKGIDKSIKHIRVDLEYSEFVNLSTEDIAFQSRDHNSWQIFSDKTILELCPGEVIPSDFLITELSPFATDPKKRTFA